MEKMAWDNTKWGQEVFFPTNPDLADMLSRTDLNFQNFYFFIFLVHGENGLGWPQMGPGGFVSY